MCIIYVEHSNKNSSQENRKDKIHTIFLKVAQVNVFIKLKTSINTLINYKYQNHYVKYIINIKKGKLDKYKMMTKNHNQS